MEIYDLAISWVWEYDYNFVNKIEEYFHQKKLKTFIIREYNIEEVTQKVKNNQLFFHCYLDRASDADESFAELASLTYDKKIYVINPYDRVKFSNDKATMHLELINAGINTPYTIILPPFNHINDIFISIDSLARLGRPFVIKPANTTGGGLGVVTGAEELQHVLEERKTFKDDKYLLQEKIIPQYIDDKRAWFRSIYAFGTVHISWWDDLTHIYTILTDEEIKKYKLKELFKITKKIAEITKMDFFSTEIALCRTNKFVVIDYVNDQCDMRFQSKHFDGVPDHIIDGIIFDMAKFVNKIKKLNISKYQND
ncbi:MAG TPA: hypothetical protein PLP99_06825 [Ignavibacteriales bacterium]|nr:hypothetical protein [Ignavibacteriales bacterium]HOL81455.1 hypothetical protein [Ignavibacteriales bacterium]HPP33618.1 hypothetical protein [Ignavibacteriales bacterium]